MKVLDDVEGLGELHGGNTRENDSPSRRGCARGRRHRQVMPPLGPWAKGVTVCGGRNDTATADAADEGDEWGNFCNTGRRIAHGIDDALGAY